MSQPTAEFLSATRAECPEYFSAFTFEYRTRAHTNRREHPMQRAKAVRAEREALLVAWLAAGRPRPPKWPAIVTFTRVAPRRLDAGDNLPSAFKAMRDELAKRLGLRNDAGEEVDWRYLQARPQELQLPAGTYAVRVAIQQGGAE